FGAIPLRLAFVVDVGSLPGIDGVAPFGGVSDALRGDLESIFSRRAEKVGVVPVPSAAGAKLHQREVPGDDHRHDALLAGLQGEAHGDSAGQRFSTADPLEVVVGKASVPGERTPDMVASELVGDE